MTNLHFKEQIKVKGLRVTLKRIAFLKTIHILNFYPPEKNITEFKRCVHSNTANDNIYQALDILVNNKIIKRVKTEKDKMKYDRVLKSHGHLYRSTCNAIEDYTTRK